MNKGKRIFCDYTNVSSKMLNINCKIIASAPAHARTHAHTQAYCSSHRYPLISWKSTSYCTKRHADSVGETKDITPAAVSAHADTSASASLYRASWFVRVVRFSSRYSSSGTLRVTDVRSRAILTKFSATVCIRNDISFCTWTALPWPDARTVWVGEAPMWGRQTEARPVALASRGPTRRRAGGPCPYKNRRRHTWRARGWKSRGDAGGPSTTEDAEAVVVCPRPVRQSAMLRYELIEVLTGRHFPETGNLRRCEPLSYIAGIYKWPVIIRPSHSCSTSDVNVSEVSFVVYIVNKCLYVMYGM